MNNQALVSIIVPVYNAEKFILHTIGSVLAQTYPHFELLLGEDCSTDNTRSLLEDYLERLQDPRIKLLKLPQNMGAARARNYCLEQAQGVYIAYIDADDEWDPGKLEKQLQFMQEKQAGFSFTGYEFADENCVGTGKIVRVPETMTYSQAVKNTTIFTTTVIFDTRIIPKDILPMPIIKSEDTALWWKVLRHGYTAYGLNESLAKYRRPGKSLSSNKWEAMRRIWNLYRKAEHMGILRSAWNFLFWAARAVLRRI